MTPWSVLEYFLSLTHTLVVLEEEAKKRKPLRDNNMARGSLTVVLLLGPLSLCKAIGTASHLKRHISAVHLKIKRSRGAK
jgi:hypothetical protein